VNINANNILRGHVDEATAYVVDDYPYGFRLRCKIRYWIESTKRGDRFCSQTTNPKVAGERWNKPKKSTYSVLMALYLNDEGHVTHAAAGNWTKLDHLQHLVDLIGELNDHQRASVAAERAMQKVMGNVTFTISEGSRSPEEEAEQASIMTTINRAIAVETHRGLSAPMTTDEGYEC